VLVLATLRSTEYDAKDSRNTPLNDILGNGNGDRIELNRLCETDVADYVKALFGEEDPKFNRAVFEKSEGNPFFMVELLRPFSSASSRKLRSSAFRVSRSTLYANGSVSSMSKPGALSR